MRPDPAPSKAPPGAPSQIAINVRLPPRWNAEEGGSPGKAFLKEFQGLIGTVEPLNPPGSDEWGAPKAGGGG